MGYILSEIHLKYARILAYKILEVVILKIANGREIISIY